MHFNEPSWISGEPRNHLVFDTTLSFLDSARSDPDRAQQLAGSTSTTLSSITTENPSVDQYRFESRVLFGILLTMVKQVDAASTQQNHQINLITSLRRVPLPATVAGQIEPRDLDSNMNEELNKLMTVLSDFERDAPLRPRLEDRPKYTPSSRVQTPWRQRCLTAGERANVNASIARLHISALDLTKLDLGGLFAMIEALEQPLTASQLEDGLPAAACWIIYTGNELRDNDIPYSYYDDDGGSKRLPWSKGELWNRRHAFSQAGWEFWMQRFKDIAERSDVSNTVRLAAWHAS